MVIFHGHPLRNGLRVARYQGMNIIFPSREDFCFDDVWLRDVYHVYQPAPEEVAAYLSMLGYTCYVYRVSLFLQKAKETYICAEFKRKMNSGCVH